MISGCPCFCRIEIQKAFEGQFCSKKGLVGSLGIGVGNRTGELALDVQLSKKADATKLPRKFYGMSAIVDIVGEVRTL
ncbi:hypothetical protein SAMN05518861_1273 [Mesorhizobium sp. YR577]|nr:hypothetical protein SAMN05518861_1273 [Mesorhizobium sp. YR577]